MKNKYFVRSRISEKKFREIIRYFSVDLTAIQIAHLTKLNINTINRILKKIRLKIAAFCEKESVFSKGEIEIDESYFGAKRVRGRRGRGSSGKTIVCGLKKRNGKYIRRLLKIALVAFSCLSYSKKYPETLQSLLMALNPMTAL